MEGKLATWTVVVAYVVKAVPAASNPITRLATGEMSRLVPETAASLLTLIERPMTSSFSWVIRVSLSMAASRISALYARLVTRSVSWVLSVSRYSTSVELVAGAVLATTAPPEIV